MKFRPGKQLAEEMWAEQFQGKAVHIDALMALDAKSATPTGITEPPGADKFTLRFS